KTRNVGHDGRSAFTRELGCIMRQINPVELRGVMVPEHVGEIVMTVDQRCLGQHTRHAGGESGLVGLRQRLPPKERQCEESGNRSLVSHGDGHFFTAMPMISKWLSC